MSMRRNFPNYLTYFRIAMIPALVGVFYLPGNLGCYLSATIFLLASITDWFDGYLARAWDAQSNIGRFLDPIADKLLVATALLLLVSGGTIPVKGDEIRDSILEGRVDVIPAIAIVCREILVSGLREFLAEIRVSVPVSRLAKWKTGAQMVAIFLLLVGPAGPYWLDAGLLGNWLIWIAAALTLVTGYAYFKTGWKHLA